MNVKWYTWHQPWTDDHFVFTMDYLLKTGRQGDERGRTIWKSP